MESRLILPPTYKALFETIMTMLQKIIMMTIEEKAIIMMIIITSRITISNADVVTYHPDHDHNQQHDDDLSRDGL